MTNWSEYSQAVDFGKNTCEAENLEIMSLKLSVPPKCTYPSLKSPGLLMSPLEDSYWLFNIM